MHSLHQYWDGSRHISPLRRPCHRHSTVRLCHAKVQYAVVRTWQYHFENDGSSARVCECIGLWVCGLRRKEETTKLLRVELRNAASRCQTAEITARRCVNRAGEHLLCHFFPKAAVQVLGPLLGTFQHDRCRARKMLVGHRPVAIFRTATWLLSGVTRSSSLGDLFC